MRYFLPFFFSLLFIEVVFAQENSSFIKRDALVLIKAGTEKEQNLFVFDTGCQMTIVSGKYADSTSYNVIGKTKSTDAYGNVKTYPIIIIPHFYIGNLYFPNVKAILMRDLWAGQQGVNCDGNIGGILGNNLLKKFNWELNFIDTTYRVSQHPICYPEETIMKIQFKEKRKDKERELPFISELNIEGEGVKHVLFDTGDPASIVLSEDVFDQLFSKDIYHRTLLIESINDSIQRVYSQKSHKGCINILSKCYSFIVYCQMHNNTQNRMGIGMFYKAIIAINYSDKTIRINKQNFNINPPKKFVGITIEYMDSTAMITSTLLEIEEKYPLLKTGIVVQKINNVTSHNMAIMHSCERSAFLNSVIYKDLNIVTADGQIYQLPAIY
jgi:hypothetical protein